ncbi:hypothetical protein FK220_007660 [Flavobacteriaceae bacterium TP-CH-4]|uniref:LTXXQ motif family protein n=1 Tax=Pelagihabitans pacificus TaxID=2696054 RepID=A0A967ARU7_9FLAO|nr:hypothetical protein [Pelagihabitans pacificus]NHF59211.1 hypothetical protein [Pelagihabitans pacificus]
MKTLFQSYHHYLIVLFLLLCSSQEIAAQFGYGQGQYGYGRRNGSIVPQAQTEKEPPKPKTADEIVDGEMPRITEVLELNEFETAVLSAILKKYVQERIEMQILKLSPDKMREGYDKITERQDEELKASLPLEKYEAFVALQKNGIQGTKRLKKKEKRKKKKKSKD